MRRYRLFAAALLMLGATPLSAQIRQVDPNDAYAPTQQAEPVADPEPPAEPLPPQDEPAAPLPGAPATGSLPPPTDEGTYTATAEATYARDDLIGAAEGVFGKGAEGLAGIVERILKEQGEPNAYIAGQEASGAFVVGLRYGSGTMFHKVEGQRAVYWTGPSVGFDVGGDANKTFVLVYNLYDSQDLYKRFPAAEGRIYLVGGFAASYMRRGDTVLIPIRLGVGWRLGANVGYMKFSEKQRWLPF